MTYNARAYIFARGGSKGVPRKNLRLVAGKSLLCRAIECARACRHVSSVVVSTDDQEIADAALRHGAEVPFMRPAHLASDTAAEWLAWQHALEHAGVTGQSSPFEAFLCVPATSPLRLPQDLDACIERLFADHNTDMVITVRPAERHPSFNMVRVDHNNAAQLAMPLPRGVTRRQDAPPLFDITTVAYAAKPRFILNARSMFDGSVKAVVIPQERALDIDTEYDLKIAQFLLEEQKR